MTLERGRCKHLLSYLIFTREHIPAVSDCRCSEADGGKERMFGSVLFSRESGPQGTLG